MKTTKKSLTNKLILGILLSSTVALTAMAVTKPKPHHSTQTKNIDVLFVQTASNAQLQPLNVQKRTFKLTMKSPNPYVSFFSERPERVTGIMPIQNYLNNWTDNGSNSFKKSPPNVALEALSNTTQSGDKHLHLMGTISNPQYDSQNKTLTYQFKLLSPIKPALKNQELAYTVLFIDSGLVHWGDGGYSHTH